MKGCDVSGGKICENLGDKIGFLNPDADENGLSDTFEAEYGVSDPLADGDGDGLNNLEEYKLGTFSASLKTTDGVLNIKKLDIDKNYKEDSWLNLGAFNISAGGDSVSQLKIEVVPLVPDVKFGDGEHDFLYMPVVAEDGNTRLNFDLGSEYTNIHSDNFNPIAIPSALDDYLAYGSLFQLFRAADGHELRTCTGSKACTPKYGSVVMGQMHGLELGMKEFFIRYDNDIEDWSFSDPKGFLRLERKFTDVKYKICPTGFCSPSQREIMDLQYAVGLSSSGNADKMFSSALHLVYSGRRNGVDGNTTALGYGSTYLSAEMKVPRSISGDASIYIYQQKNNSKAGTIGSYPIEASAVRCIAK